MPLELRKQRDGSLRDFWYGVYEVNGNRLRPNLGIKVSGKPPSTLSLRDEGDSAFERSRATAQAKLEGLIEEARSNQNAERLVEKLYEIKTGEHLKSIKLADLPDEWKKIERKRKPDDQYASQCQSTLKRFVEYVIGQNSKANEIAHVTRTIARGFMEAEGLRGVSGKTWNDTLKLLRATFKYLLPAGAINPFTALPTKDTDTIFRIPFSPEELKAIMDVAKNDDFIRPIIVVGVCSAMRRGDCCLLQPKDVDLKNRFITVKTAKTGQTVSIPIFPLLYDELVDRMDKKAKYVFPEQAQMYLENPDGITLRVQKVLLAALQKPKAIEIDLLPEVSESDAKAKGLQYISTITHSERRERMQSVFEAYMQEIPMKQLVEKCGVSKGSVSGYLNEIEKEIGCKIVRGRADGTKLDWSLLSQEREGGLRRASVRDFHSFRVTWVTLALTAGVPLELVQKVTGHKTTEIVLKHYFQPGREAFRHALQTAMPKLLTNGQKSPKDEMKEIIEKMTAKTWKRDQKRLQEILERS